jgi:hypothetical protein
LTKTRDDQTSKAEFFASTVIRTRGDSYEEPERLPVSEGAVASPFKGKTPLECHHILLEIMNSTSPNLECFFFVVMDDQAIEDETVLLVGMVEGQIHTMREEFEIANSKLNALSAGYGAWPDELESTPPPDD